MLPRVWGSAIGRALVIYLTNDGFCLRLEGLADVHAGSAGRSVSLSRARDESCAASVDVIVSYDGRMDGRMSGQGRVFFFALDNMRQFVGLSSRSLFRMS